MSLIPQDYESSEDEEDPLKTLLKKFNKNIKNDIKAVSDSDSDEEADEENGELDELELQGNDKSSENDESDNSESELQSDKNEIDSSCTSGEELEENETSKKTHKKNKYLPDEKEKTDQIVIKENEEDEETAQEDAGHVNDPFTIHFRNDLDSELYQSLIKVPAQTKVEKLNWPNLGNIICHIPSVEEKIKEPSLKKMKVSILEDKIFAEHGKVPQLIDSVNWNDLYVKSLIQGNITKANYNNIKDLLDKNPSPLSLFSKCDSLHVSSTQILFLIHYQKFKNQN